MSEMMFGGAGGSDSIRSRLLPLILQSLATRRLRSPGMGGPAGTTGGFGGDMDQPTEVAGVANARPPVGMGGPPGTTGGIAGPTRAPGTVGLTPPSGMDPKSLAAAYIEMLRQNAPPSDRADTMESTGFQRDPHVGRILNAVKFAIQSRAGMLEPSRQEMVRSKQEAQRRREQQADDAYRAAMLGYEESQRDARVQAAEGERLYRDATLKETTRHNQAEEGLTQEQIHAGKQFAPPSPPSPAAESQAEIDRYLLEGVKGGKYPASVLRGVGGANEVEPTIEQRLKTSDAMFQIDDELQKIDHTLMAIKQSRDSWTPWFPNVPVEWDKQGNATREITSKEEAAAEEPMLLRRKAQLEQERDYYKSIPAQPRPGTSGGGGAVTPPPSVTDADYQRATPLQREVLDLERKGMSREQAILEVRRRHQASAVGAGMSRPPGRPAETPFGGKE